MGMRALLKLSSFTLSGIPDQRASLIKKVLHGFGETRRAGNALPLEIPLLPGIPATSAIWSFLCLIEAL